MEACSRECLKEDVFRVVSCAKLRCTIFCFNGDCPQCSGIAKRIFVRVCRNYDIPNMPNVQFNGTCQELFSSVIKHYLDTRQSNNWGLFKRQNFCYLKPFRTRLTALPMRFIIENLMFFFFFFLMVSWEDGAKLKLFRTEGKKIYFIYFILIFYFIFISYGMV